MKLKFKKGEDGNYEVRNGRKEILGTIDWYPEWKCWVWEQELCIVMSKDCLKQVIDFIDILNEKR